VIGVGVGVVTSVVLVEGMGAVVGSSIPRGVGMEVGVEGMSAAVAEAVAEEAVVAGSRTPSPSPKQISPASAAPPNKPSHGRFPDSQIPKFPNFKIFEFPDSHIPKLPLYIAGNEGFLKSYAYMPMFRAYIPTQFRAGRSVYRVKGVKHAKRKT
jgi:hypothetical protein